MLKIVFILIFFCFSALGSEPILSLKNTRLFNGKMTYFIINVPDDNIHSLTVEAFKHKSELIKVNDSLLLGFISPHINTQQGEYFINLAWQKNNRNFSKHYPIAIFKSNIVTNNSNFNPSPAVLKQIKKDKLWLKKNIYLQKSSAKYWDGEFILPLQTNHQTNFGTFNNKNYVHNGVRLYIESDNLVKAINNGLVRLAKKIAGDCNTIILDHGNDIFSIYTNLDSILLQEGDLVNKGQVLGVITKETHLQFAIKINNIIVDPFNFIKVINKSLAEIAYLTTQQS